MSTGFFKIKKGTTLDPQSQYGSGDPSDGTDGDIYYNSVLNLFRIYQDGAWANLSSGSGTSLWVAKQVVLTNGTTSFAVSFASAQPDTSYVVLGMMGNTTDAFPQYQQIEVTSKTTAGFTFTWNHPLDSGNYFISYVVPPKTLPTTEVSISSGVNTLSTPLLIAQPYSGYGVITQLQNTVDANPQFQTVLVGTNTSSTINLSWNVNTDTANYKDVYMIGATGQTAISSGATSVTITLPVSFGSTNYAIVASIQDTVDTNPQFQPHIITALSSGSATIGWNVATDTNNYLLNWYVLSLTS